MTEIEKEIIDLCIKTDRFCGLLIGNPDSEEYLEKWNYNYEMLKKSMEKKHDQLIIESNLSKEVFNSTYIAVLSYENNIEHYLKLERERLRSWGIYY